jgi:hypothetical protein
MEQTTMQETVPTMAARTTPSGPELARLVED